MVFLYAVNLFSMPGHTDSAICRSDGDSDVRCSQFIHRPLDGETKTDRRFFLKHFLIQQNIIVQTIFQHSKNVDRS